MNDNVDIKIIKNYEIIKKLGKGAYGQVWKCVNKKKKYVCALKRIFDAFRNVTDCQHTYRQIMYLKELDHPNIIKLFNYEKSLNERDMYIQLQFVESDLLTALKNQYLKDIQKEYIFTQCTSAIYYLHSGNLIHRDLKPSNILVGANCQAKLCDFGLIRGLTANQNQNVSKLTDNIATRWYKAPQLLLSSCKYGKQIDIWSLGCLLAELYLGKPLFQGTSTFNQLEKIIEITGIPAVDKLCEIIQSQTSLAVLKSFINDCSNNGGRNNSIQTKTKRQSLCYLSTSQSKQISQQNEQSVPSNYEKLLQIIPAIKSWSSTMNPKNNQILDLLTKMLQFDPRKRLKIEQIIEHPFLSKFRNKVQISKMQKAIKIKYENTKLTIDQYKRILNNKMKVSNTSITNTNSHNNTNTNFVNVMPQNQCRQNSLTRKYSNEKYLRKSLDKKQKSKSFNKNTSNRYSPNNKSQKYQKQQIQKQSVHITNQNTKSVEIVADQDQTDGIKKRISWGVISHGSTNAREIRQTEQQTPKVYSSNNMNSNMNTMYFGYRKSTKITNQRLTIQIQNNKMNKQEYKTTYINTIYQQKQSVTNTNILYNDKSPKSNKSANINNTNNIINQQKYNYKIEWKAGNQYNGWRHTPNLGGQKQRSISISANKSQNKSISNKSNISNHSEISKVSSKKYIGQNHIENQSRTNIPTVIPKISINKNEHMENTQIRNYRQSFQKPTSTIQQIRNNKNFVQQSTMAQNWPTHSNASPKISPTIYKKQENSQNNVNMDRMPANSSKNYNELSGSVVNRKQARRSLYSNSHQPQPNIYGSSNDLNPIFIEPQKTHPNHNHQTTPYNMQNPNFYQNMAKRQKVQYGPFVSYEQSVYNSAPSTPPPLDIRIANYQMQQASIGPGSPSTNNYIPYQTYTEQNYQSNPNVYSGFSQTLQPYMGNKVGTNGNFANIINKRENKNVNEVRNFKDWKKF